MTIQEMVPTMAGSVARERRENSRTGGVERMTQILDVLASGPERMLLEEIAARAGVPRSTTYRILAQLVDLDWVEQDSPGYRLGPRIQAFATRSSDNFHLRSAAANTLNELHLATGAVAHLTILDGVSIRYLDKIGSATANIAPSRIGGRHLAARSTSGRALLACLSPEDVDSLLGRRDGLAGTGGLSVLHRRLSQVRSQRGISLSHAEHNPFRLNAVAAPIAGRKGAVAAVSLVSDQPMRFEVMASMVASAARHIADALRPLGR